MRNSRNPGGGPPDASEVVLSHKKILLVRRPEGLPKPDDFRLEATNLSLPALWFCPHSPAAATITTESTAPTTLVLETLYVSIDPAMRGWMSSARSYLPPVKLGSVMRASTICRVIAASNHSLAEVFPLGAIVRTELVGVQSHCLVKNCSVGKANKLLTRLDHTGIVPRSPNRAKHSLSYASYLGVLGTTGLTAYFGLLRVGQPKPSDVVLVSGAAGATGSIVCQIARHAIGCKLVIGTAGTDAKCDWLVSKGIVDVAINYKTAGNLSKAIAKACKTHQTRGVDLVFDNVGSAFLEAALSNLARNARIVLCGAISQYNAAPSASGTISGPRNYMNLLVKRATMKGFVVFDYQKEYPKAIRDLVQWISQGKIRCYEEDLRHVGIEAFYPALLSLFEGTNVGKVVLKATESEERGGGAVAVARSRL